MSEPPDDIVARIKARALEILQPATAPAAAQHRELPRSTEHPDRSVAQETGAPVLGQTGRGVELDDRPGPSTENPGSGTAAGSAAPRAGFLPYEEADLSDFPAYGTLGETADRQLHAMLDTVLQVESPAHFETILDRLRIHWDMGRAREPTRQHVLRSIDRFAASKDNVGLDRRDAAYDLFLTLSDRAVIPRSPGIRGTRRVLHIAPSELAAGVLICIDREGSAYREDLIRLVRGAFGYSRTGPDIYTAIDAAIDQLLRVQQLAESFGRLRTVQ